MSSRTFRLIAVPAILLVVVSGIVFGLAKWHPAKRESAPATVATARPDPVRGQQLFVDKCETCHGESGEGGGIGPALAGSGLTTEQARARIVNGGGVMPAGLVEGQNLEDVLAYLQAVFHN